MKKPPPPAEMMKNGAEREFPAGPVVGALRSHTEVRSLVGKLISHKLHGVAKIFKKKGQKS